MVNGSNVDQKLTKLSEGQRICLRLVNTHHSSKQIALILNISRHTVDQRLALACKALGLASRRDAARLFAEYESVVYEPIDIGDPDPFDASVPSNVNREDNTAGNLSEYLREDQVEFELSKITQPKPMNLPFPLYKGQSNDLNLQRRLIWIFAIFSGSIVITGVLIVALEALGRLL